MLLLAIDTAHHACSAALAKDGHVLASEIDVNPSHQAETLLPMVEAMLHTAHCQYSDLDTLAVNVGPGSFTGIRIGLAAVKAIAMAAAIPLVGVTSLEILAWQVYQKQSGPSPILTALDARRGQVYIQPFTHEMHPLEPPGLYDLGDPIPEFLAMKSWVGVGNGIPLLAPLLQDSGTEIHFIETVFPPEASIMAQWVDFRLRMHPGEQQPVQPLYLRKPDAKLPKKLG